MKKNLKRNISLILIVIVAANLVFLNGCNKPAEEVVDESITDGTTVTEAEYAEEEAEEGKEDTKEITVSECDLPDYEWQKDITFPNDNGYVDDTLVMNSTAAVKTYQGQGLLYVTPSSDIETFSMYINHARVDVDSMSAGKTYLIDYGDYAVSGNNDIQVSAITPASASVSVKAPYPVITEGTPEDVGMDTRAFELIDAVITSETEYGFPSAQMAVIKDGVLIYNNAWGYANRYDGMDAVTTDTLYDLASNTKMYSVAYAIQRLVSEGKITMDTKISDILGEEFYNGTVDICFKGYEDYYKKGQDANREWKANITIRDVMSHKAGFPGAPAYQRQIYDQAMITSKTDVENILYAGSDGSFETRENTYRIICKTPLMYKPGDKVLYTDVDYMVLAFCIEQITGQRLDEYMENEFYAPMGLEHICYRPLDHGFEKKDCAATEPYGNTRSGTEYFEGVRTETIQGEVHDEMAYYTMAGVSGHAGLFSNAEDLAKLASVMLMGGYGDKSFFTKDVMDAFTAPSSDVYSNWGVGWYREGDERRDYFFSEMSPSDTIGHQGWTGTITLIDPDNNLVIVYLTNKINTEITDVTYNNNKFDGNWYTSATLGFATEMVYEALNPSGEDNGALDELLLDMVKGKFALVDKATSDYLTKSSVTTDVDENHPVVKSAYALLEVLIQRVDDVNSEDSYIDGTYDNKYYNYAFFSLELLDDKRDSNEIARLINISPTARKYFDEN